MKKNKALTSSFSSKKLTTTQTSISPSACPKFNQCNAPICPLDNEWHRRGHFSEDKCCYYLLETSKSNAKAIFEGAGLVYLYESIERVKQKLLPRYASLKRAYDRAKTTPSRMHPKFSRSKRNDTKQ